MSIEDHNQHDTDGVEAGLIALAKREQRQRAPSALHAAIRNNAHGLMRAQQSTTAAHTPAESKFAVLVQQLQNWLGAHWWRTASMASTMAAIPLLTGVLLGYQLTDEEQAMSDPANEWLSSYSAIVDTGEAATTGASSNES